jgi:hypothetical protein
MRVGKEQITLGDLKELTQILNPAPTEFFDNKSVAPVIATVVALAQEAKRNHIEIPEGNNPLNFMFGLQLDGPRTIELKKEGILADEQIEEWAYPKGSDVPEDFRGLYAAINKTKLSTPIWIDEDYLSKTRQWLPFTRASMRPQPEPFEAISDALGRPQSEIAKIRGGPHRAMPNPQATPAAQGNGSWVTVKNDSQFDLWVYYAGPVSLSIHIGANGTSAPGSLLPGQYEVAARLSSSPSTMTFYGIQSYSPATQYSVNFSGL